MCPIFFHIYMLISNFLTEKHTDCNIFTIFAVQKQMSMGVRLTIAPEWHRS